ncbi:hypothetical protein M0R72_06595 [Candidatus Pacearchaeota archaeon]|jgi:hypothetical protein|nr:hypothetical protein [Candidatus Pacearchaeota archaeon]
MEILDFEILNGKTLRSIEGTTGDDKMVFVVDDKEQYVLFHNQECSEHVTVEDIAGDIADLIGTPIIEAEEISGDIGPEGWKPDKYAESWTWTFYKISTIKGSVTIRWFGCSNGYYSERVDLVTLDEWKQN